MLNDTSHAVLLLLLLLLLINKAVLLLLLLLLLINKAVLLLLLTRELPLHNMLFAWLQSLILYATQCFSNSGYNTGVCLHAFIWRSC